MAHARENRGALLSPLLGELVICQLFSLEIFCGRFASLEHECLMADEDDIIHIFQTIMRLFYSFNYSFSDLNGICGPCPSMNGIDRRLQPVTVGLMLFRVFPMRIHQHVYVHQHHEGSSMMSSNERPLSKSTPGFTPGPETVINRIVSCCVLDFARDSRKAFSTRRARETLSSSARCLAAISN